MLKKIKKTNIIVFTLLFTLFIQSFIVIQKNAIITDETVYASIGYAYFRTSNFQLGPYDPPLIKEILALPLLILNPNYEEVSFDENIDRFQYNEIYIPNFLFKLNNNADQIILWARVMTSILSIIGGFFVYLWAKELYGTNAGLFALFLYTFSTTILSFSWIANLDIGIVTFIIIALYFLWKYFKEPSTKNLIISGITLGLALAAKTTGIFLIPILFIIFLINRFPRTFKQAYKTSTTLLITISIALLTVFACYEFQTSTIASNIHAEGKESALEILPDIPLIRYIVEEVPLPLSHYVIQLYTRSRSSKIEWFDTYLMGKYSKSGWKHYYLIQMLIKVQIPLLIFILLTIFLYKKFNKKDNKYDSFLLIPILFLFIYLSLFNKLNSGIRYLLPIFPLLFIWVSKIINIKIRRKALLNYFIIIMCLWYLVSALLISPYYISYFNEFIGGPKNGHKYLIDSDLDWGQDVKELRDYINQNNIKSIKMNVIGLPDYYNIKYEKLECGPKEGLIVVSASRLHGFFMEDKECYLWLLNHKPIKKIGYSIFIYNIPEASSQK